jgi:hypothetical protein
MKHWPSLLIIAVSAVLMQVHSIAFWMDHAGITGVGFSLALEIVALWLWWQRCNWLAVIASALLVGGPLFQLSAPVIDSLYRNHANEQLIMIHQTEIKQLSASLARYDENSSERIGWAARIDKTQAEITDARKTIKTLLALTAKKPASQLYFVVLMQALALFIIMRSQIIAVKKLPLVTVIEQNRTRAVTAPMKLQTAPVTTVKKPDAFDVRVEALAEKMRLQLSRTAAKQKDLATVLNVRPADISMALKHAENKAAGRTVISERALLKIENALQGLHA